MMAGILLAVALAGPALGVALLRLGWGRPRRSVALNTGGWALLIGGALAGGVAEGAWGVSMSALTGMVAASLALAWAAATSPPPSRVRASNRRVGMLPERGEPLRLAGRALTFVIVVLVAATVSLGLAVTSRGVAARAGLGAADATALASFLLPVAWTLIAFVLLMQRSRRRQAMILGIVSLPILALGIVA